MKECFYCGTQQDDHYETCKVCGSSEFRAVAPNPERVMPEPEKSVQNEAYNYGQPENAFSNQTTYVNDMPERTGQPPLSKKEFLRDHCPDFTKRVRSAAIIYYICVAVTVLVAIAVMPTGLLDAGILLALTVGMHIKQSKGCAYVALFLSVLEVIASILMGQATGWLWLVAGIMAIKAFRDGDKAYEEYVQNNNVQY